MVRRRVDYSKMHLITKAMYEKLKKCLDDDKKPPHETSQYVSEIIDPIPGPSNVTITRPDYPEGFSIFDDEPQEPQQEHRQPQQQQQDSSSFFETQEIPSTGERIPPKRGIKTADVRKIKSSKHRKLHGFTTPVRRKSLVVRRPLPIIREDIEETQFVEQPEHEISSGSDVDTPPRPIRTSTPMPQYREQTPRHTPQQRDITLHGITPIVDDDPSMDVNPEEHEEIHAIVPVQREITRFRRPIQIEEIGSESFHDPDFSNIRSIRTNFPPLPITSQIPVLPRIQQPLAIQTIPRQLPAIEHFPQQATPPQPIRVPQTRSRFRQLPLTSCDEGRPTVRVVHDEGDTEISDLPTLNRFTCPICGKHFSSKFALQRHIKTKHSNEPDSTTKPYTYSRDPRDPPTPPPQPSAKSSETKFQSWVQPGKRSSAEAKLKQHQPRKYKTKPMETKVRFDSWNL